MIRKIISGGQTGADRGGLEGARLAGVETGGTAPLGYLTERGEDKSLKNFGLSESASRKYPPRTKKNVGDSDGTLIIGKLSEPGSKLTARLCDELGKPCFKLPALDPSDVAEFDVNSISLWAMENGVEILNVAGNRESKMPGLQKSTKKLIAELLKISSGEILQE